jgi:hypothetical protein
VGAPAYAELLAYPKATESFVNGHRRRIRDSTTPFGLRLAGVLHAMQSGDEELPT